MKNYLVTGLVALAAIVIGIVILVADPFAPKAEGKTYANPAYGFTLEWDGDFEEAVAVLEGDGVVYFLDRSVAGETGEEPFGVIGRIEAYEKARVDEAGLAERSDLYGFRLLGENSAYSIGAAHATDVQLPPGASEEEVVRFRELEAAFDTVLESIQINEPKTYAFLGFLVEADPAAGTAVFDPVEWIVLDNEERIRELGLSPDADMPNGFYVYNETGTLLALPVDEAAEIRVLDWNDLAEPVEAELAAVAEQAGDYEYLFQVLCGDGRILDMEEMYRP